MATFVEVHPDNPQHRTVNQVVERIREGALVAFPTDSGYALGGRLDDQSIKDRIRDIRHLDDRLVRIQAQRQSRHLFGLQ